MACFLCCVMVWPSRLTNLTCGDSDVAGRHSRQDGIAVQTYSSALSAVAKSHKLSDPLLQTVVSLYVSVHSETQGFWPRLMSARSTPAIASFNRCSYSLTSSIEQWTSLLFSSLHDTQNGFLQLPTRWISSHLTISQSFLLFLYSVQFKPVSV